MSAVPAPVSRVERAVAGWLIQRPVTVQRLPVSVLSREQEAAELQRLQARKAMDAAYEAELVLGLADDSPDDDPPPGTPGARSRSWQPDAELPGVSEFFTAELALVLNCGRVAAGKRAHRAWTHRESLPGTWATLAAGALDEYRAMTRVEVLQHTDPAIARQVETRLLPHAAEWTAGVLKRRALESLLERDPDSADRREQQAKRRSDVRVYPSVHDGMSTIAADLPPEVAAACFEVVDRLACMLEADGDERPIGELRTLVYAALLQRPWEHHGRRSPRTCRSSPPSRRRPAAAVRRARSTACRSPPPTSATCCVSSMPSASASRRAER